MCFVKLIRLFCGTGALVHLLRMGWRNFFSCCAIVSVFWFWGEMVLPYLAYNTWWHIGIGILRGRRTDRWLHMYTLILIPTFKSMFFCIPDRRTEKLIRGGLGNYVKPGKNRPLRLIPTVGLWEVSERKFNTTQLKSNQDFDTTQLKSNQPRSTFACLVHPTYIPTSGTKLDGRK